MSARDGQETAVDDREGATAKEPPKLATAKSFGERLEESGAVQLLVRYRRPALVIGWLAASGIASIQGPGFVFLILISGALILAISLFWASIRTMLGETSLTGADAFAIAAPRAEEEQKQAVLRALKDLEFERSVGKISDEDYAELVTKYRREAKRLLRSLEDEARPGRDRVEKLVRDHLIAAGLEQAPLTEPSAAEVLAEPKGKKKAKKGKAAGKAPAEAAASDEAREVVIEPVADDAPKAKANVDTTWKSEGTAKTKESPAYVPATKQCSECHTKNDPDAVFCKKCGSKSFETAAAKADAKDAGAAEKKDGAAEGSDEAAEDEAANDEARGTTAAEEAR